MYDEIPESALVPATAELSKNVPKENFTSTFGDNAAMENTVAESEIQHSSDKVKLSEAETPVKIIPAGDEIINRRLRLSETKRYTMPEMNLEEDFLVPDIRPDLEKILTVDAMPEISNYEVYTQTGEKKILRISGNMEISTLYVPSRKGKGLVAITSRIPFRYEREISDNLSKNAQIKAIVNNLDSHVINERKIRVNASVVFHISDYGDTEIELLEGVADDSLLLKKEKIRFTDMAYRKSDTAELSEKIILRDNYPEPASILKYDVNIVENHRQISKGKVILEASLYYSILYIPEKEEDAEGMLPIFYRGKTDFTQFIRVPDLSAGEITGLVVNYNIDAADILMKSDSGESLSEKEIEAKKDLDSTEAEDKSHFNLDAQIETTIYVYREIEREMVTDMYHRTKNLNFSTSNHQISRLRSTGATEVTVRDTINIPESAGRTANIPYISVKIGALDIRWENDRCQVEGFLIADIIFVNENSGTINSYREMVPLKTAVDLPEGSLDVTPECIAELRDVWFDRLNGHQIDFSCGIAVRINTWDITSYDFIDRVCYIENEGNDNRRASMVVYVTMPGDTQWSIARKFRTTMETLQAVNGLQEDEEPAAGRRLLII